MSLQCIRTHGWTDPPPDTTILQSCSSSTSVLAVAQWLTFSVLFRSLWWRRIICTAVGTILSEHATRSTCRLESWQERWHWTSCTRNWLLRALLRSVFSDKHHEYLYSELFMVQHTCMLYNIDYLCDIIFLKLCFFAVSWMFGFYVLC